MTAKDKPLVGIIQYGSGNIRSIVNALKILNVDYSISDDPKELERTDKVILPGVGEARSAMNGLERTGLAEWIRHTRKPYLGICLGMQILYGHTTERSTDCLGIISGTVRKFERKDKALKIHHMGWNTVRCKKNNPLFEGLPNGAYLYYVHSYFGPVVPETIALTEYDGEFSAAVNTAQYYGVQFHPEKSGETGLHILKNFIERC